MTSPATNSGSGEDRIANVSAVLIATADDRHTRELTLGLSSLFEDVLVVPRAPDEDHPGEAALRELVSALSAAREDRVLVVSAEGAGAAPPTSSTRATPHLWLALTAWPEHDVVMPASPRGADPLCALYRRGPALATAQEQLAAGDAGTLRLAESRGEALQGVAAALDAQVMEAQDLMALREEES